MKHFFLIVCIMTILLIPLPSESADFAVAMFDPSSNILKIPYLIIDDGSGFTFYKAEFQLDSNNNITLTEISPKPEWSPENVPGTYHSDDGMEYTFYENGTGLIRWPEGSLESYTPDSGSLEIHWNIGLYANLEFSKYIPEKGYTYEYIWALHSYEENAIEVYQRFSATTQCTPIFSDYSFVPVKLTREAH